LSTGDKDFQTEVVVLNVLAIKACGLLEGRGRHGCGISLVPKFAAKFKLGERKVIHGKSI
jgi:hypothetical protein